MVNTARHM